MFVGSPARKEEVGENMEGLRKDNAEGQRRKRRGENRNRKVKMEKDEKNGEEEGKRMERI